MLATLALVSLLAVPTIDAPVPEAEQPPQPYWLNVYFEPVAFSAVAAGGFFTHGAVALFLPFGATAALGPSWGLSFELAPTFIISPDHGLEGGGLSASFGVTWLPQRRGIDGWFVTPKLTVDVSHVPAYSGVCWVFGGCRASVNNGPVDLGPGISRSVLAGVDVGYQFPTRPITTALVFGASAGYGYDGNGIIVSPLLPTSTATGSNRIQGFVWALNLAILRVGLGR